MMRFRFSASNAVVFAQYTLAAFGQPITPHNQTLAAVSVVLITVAGNTHLQYKYKGIYLLCTQVSRSQQNGLCVPSTSLHYSRSCHWFCRSIWSLRACFLKRKVALLLLGSLFCRDSLTLKTLTRISTTHSKAVRGISMPLRLLLCVFFFSLVKWG